MTTNRLKQHLDERRVKYTTIAHSPAYTAQELAAKTHVHGWEIAKATILRADGEFVMAVLPAPLVVDFARIREVIGKPVSLASEDDVERLFPGCERGAIPPFGNLYGMRVYMDSRLVRDESIVFCSGTHKEGIRMDLDDYTRLVEPTIASFGSLKT